MSTDDSPEREFDVYLREGFLRAPLDDTEDTSNVSESEDLDWSNPSNSTEMSKSSRTLRRVVRRLDLGLKTDDSPEREFDVYLRKGFSRAPLDDTEGTSNVSESKDLDLSNSMKMSKSSRTPRREVRWLDKGLKNLSLESIKRRFGDLLDRFLSSSSNSLLRHVTSPIDRHYLHQCPGYLREEITLVSDVSKNVIVYQLVQVQYKFTGPSVVDIEMQEDRDDQIQIWQQAANGRSEHARQSTHFAKRIDIT